MAVLQKHGIRVVPNTLKCFYNFTMVLHLVHPPHFYGSTLAFANMFTSLLQIPIALTTIIQE